MPLQKIGKSLTRLLEPGIARPGHGGGRQGVMPKPPQLGRRPQMSTSLACSMMKVSGLAMIQGRISSGSAVVGKKGSCEVLRLGERFTLPVLGGQCGRAAEGPMYGDSRIIPGNAALVFRRIVIGGFVEKLRCFR